MSLTFKRLITGVFLATVLSLSAWAQAAPQKNWKDRAEYDLVQSIQGQQDANKRLELIGQWKDKYPATEFKTERNTLLLATYQQLGNGQKMRDVAREMVADDPNGIGNYWLTVLTTSLKVTSEQEMAEGEKAANGLLTNLDSIYTKEKNPSATDEVLKTQKTAAGAAAHDTLAYIAQQRKNMDVAEAELKKSLEVNPANGTAAYQLGATIIGEKKPEKSSEAIFYIARAVAYSGPGEFPADAKKSASAYLERVYTSFHGSKDGLDQLLATAKTTPAPPADFKIVSKVEQDQAAVAKENADIAAHPELALWKGIKDQLTAAGGEGYFSSTLKGSAVPKLKGKLVSQSPALNPKKLVLALSDGTTPEVTLDITPALRGKAEPGTDISFEGIPASFSKEPFNVTFDVEKAKISGWPAQAAAAPARPRAGARKKR